MAPEPRREVSTGPQVRNACEECHSRKIKCHTTNDGACRACQNNGRLCFFLPRNKSGRPKLGQDGSKEGKQQNPGLATTAAAAAAAIAEHAALAEAASSPMSQTRSQHSPSGSSRSSSQHSNPGIIRGHNGVRSMSEANMDMAFPMMSNVEWPNAPLPKPSSELLDMDMESSFPFQEIPSTSVDGYFDYHRMNLNMASQHLHSVSHPGSLDSLSSTIPSIPSGSDFSFNKAGPSPFFPTPLSSIPPTPMFSATGEFKPEGCFPALLAHIYRLQRCHEKVRSGTLFSYAHTRNDQLKMVVSTIDSGCIATCTTLKDQFQVVLGQRAEAKMNNIAIDQYREPSPIRPDHSLIALAITTILTIARLCQALMQSELPDAQSSLDNMLLFKKLGCNILQTRIALMNIEKLDRGLTYLTEDATREISIVQAEFENMKKHSWNQPSFQ